MGVFLHTHGVEKATSLNHPVGVLSISSLINSITYGPIFCAGITVAE
jgi:hypothetical protein